MKYKTLGNTTLKVSELGLGTMQFGWTVDKRHAHQMLDYFVAHRGNLIDTADMYCQWVKGKSGGESETMIGSWIQKRKKRDDLIISTKVRTKMWEGEDGEGLSKAHIIRACEESLKRLKTDYIDLYQSHWSDSETPIEETLAAYELLIKQGKVRFIGCSNYSLMELKEALEKKSSYQSIQAYYNLVERQNYEDNLLSQVKEHNLGVLAYGPLASGFLSEEMLQGKIKGHPRESFLISKSTPESLMLLKKIERVATKYEKSISQVALRYLLQTKSITAVLIGSDSLDQLVANMKSAEWGLSARDYRLLSRSRRTPSFAGSISDIEKPITIS